MRGFLLINGDLSFSNGELTMIDGLDEIAQSLSIIIQTRLGEFYLDETVGTNWDALLTKGFDENAAHDAIVEALMEDDRVEQVTDIEFSISGRILSVAATIQTATGDPVQIADVSIDTSVGGGSGA